MRAVNHASVRTVASAHAIAAVDTAGSGHVRRLATGAPSTRAAAVAPGSVRRGIKPLSAGRAGRGGGVHRALSRERRRRLDSVRAACYAVGLGGRTGSDIVASSASTILPRALRRANSV